MINKNINSLALKNMIGNFSKNITLSFIAIMFVGFTNSLTAQCDSDDFMDDCAELLDEFNFIKAYDFENDKGGGSYSYVFSKGSMYKIIICDENIEGNRMVIKLLDRNRRMIASNYSARSKKYYPSIKYPCSATGVYYIEYSFEGGKASCGMNILGFSKQ
jgi:hypothetical protein